MDTPNQPSSDDPSNRGLALKISEAILQFVGKVPTSSQPPSPTPAASAHSIANTAAMKAAATAGALAIPPGPAAYVTILPEILTVWRIQAQMVADIAAVHGKASLLSQEQMIYCLFRHTAAQAMRDIVIRVGERYLVKRASLRTLQKIAEKVGIRITQRVIKKAISRWVPVVGALGVGGYAWYDTANVAKTAIDLFSSDIDRDPGQAGEPTTVTD